MSDARLLLGTALALPAAFALFVLVPYTYPALPESSGLGPVWGLAGMLALLLGPLVGGVVLYLSGICLLVGKDVTAAERRLHLATLATTVAFVVLLASEPSASAVDWWLG